MKKIKIQKSKALLLLSLVLILMTGIRTGIAAGDSKVSLAVLPFENLNKDPEQDYLSGIIGSIIRQDLSLSGMVFLVDRDNLSDVLEEQKLQFTGVMDDESIIETGRLIGAQYILKGGYVFLGQDLFLNLDLIDTETGRSYSFSERGYQENTVHALTEKLIRHLTGKDMSFQSPGGEKSIIAVSQQEPGRVLLFSPLIDARIYVDNQFAAYTQGDMTTAVELVLPAGRHVIRTHLSRDFGVVRTPEIIFSDWQEEFILESGQTLVLEDKTTHFNSILYDLQQIVRERISIVPGTGETGRAEHREVYRNRSAEEVELGLDISLIESEGEGGIALIRLSYDGRVEELRYNSPAGQSQEFKLDLGDAELRVDLDCSSNYRWSLDYSIWRTDIYQGLHREEAHQNP